MKLNERNYKQFSLKNALICFSEKKNHWGEIADISGGGFKLLTNRILK